MPKIVFVNRYFFPDHSATSQLLTDLAFELAKARNEVWVVTSRQSYENPAATLPADETAHGVRIRRVWTSRFGRHRLAGRAFDYLTFYFSAAWALFRILDRTDIVVAKTDPPLISVVAMIIAKLRSARLINWIQDLFPEVALELGVRGIGSIAGPLRRLRNRSLRAARMNVVLGERMAQRVAAEGIAADAVTVIHNWADGDGIRPVRREDNPLRREWGLESSFVVGYSGNIGRAHEFRTLLDAAERLKSNDLVRFLFIGGGARLPWIAEESRRRGLSNVQFRPYQPRERLAVSLSVPDVHVISLLPELEGLIVPSKFYGIAAAGRPTLFIGDPDGEIPRVLQESECGSTVAPGDAVAAAAWLADMAENRDAIKRMSARARAVFENRFSRDRAFGAWTNIVHRVQT